MDVCFSLRFDDDLDIDVPCGQHQLMPAASVLSHCTLSERPMSAHDSPIARHTEDQRITGVEITHRDPRDRDPRDRAFPLIVRWDQRWPR